MVAREESLKLDGMAVITQLRAEIDVELNCMLSYTLGWTSECFSFERKYRRKGSFVRILQSMWFIQSLLTVKDRSERIQEGSLLSWKCLNEQLTACSKDLYVISS